MTISVAGQAIDREGLELAIIEAGADNYDDHGDAFVVYTDPKQLTAVKAHLENQTIRIDESKLSWEPMQTVTVADADTAKQILKLMNTLEDLEDVTAVTANFDLPDELMASL
jgi:transcriptional/translational regulatory protein YebC/TACO1